MTVVAASNTITTSKSREKKKSWDFWAKWVVDSSSSPMLRWININADDKYLLSAIKTSIFLIFIFAGTHIAIHWSHHLSSFAEYSMQLTFAMVYNNSLTNYSKREEYIVNCTSSKMSITCPPNYPPTNLKRNVLSNRTCPDYFRWIHEDLKIWKEKGIERHMVESLQHRANFRLVIVNGVAYVNRYIKSFQTRDMFTLWGILQLLKLYPGRIPDLDLMFECNDFPTIKMELYPGEQSAYAPPMFHYCRNDTTFDIVFPDWSFWGWPEFKIKPWEPLAEDLKKGNSMKNWRLRKPYAFWKGTLFNGGKARLKLVECDSIEDWNAEIIHQSWSKETRYKFKASNLLKQCVHRYKIYIEGNAWSASLKYILACDSLTLLVDPVYYDFFTRSLIPMKHYWPINPTNLCKSIKFAVNQGNNNTNKAQEIGKEGSQYIFEQVQMEHVYDYMFHLLNEYAKLLKYKPTVPEGAVELCSEEFACSPMGLETTYKIESMVNEPAEYLPCNLPPQYDSNTLQILRNQKDKIKDIVNMWGNGSS